VFDELKELVPALLLHVGGRCLALGLDVVERIVTLDGGVYPVPGAPAPIEGIISSHGSPALAVDIARLFGQSATVQSNTVRHGVLCRHGRVRAILVGGLVRSVGRFRQVPDFADEELACRGLEWRGGTIPLLDLGQLLEAALGGGRRSTAPPVRIKEGESD